VKSLLGEFQSPPPSCYGPCGQTPRPAAAIQVRPPWAAPNRRIISTRSYSLFSGRPDVAAPRDHLALLIEGGHFLRIPTALIVSLGAAFCAAGLGADRGMWMLQQLRDAKKSPYLDVALRRCSGQFPLDGRYDRRQVRIPHPERQGRTRRALVRRHLRIRGFQIRLRPVTTRSIQVDSRYLLWNMADVNGAINLLREMGITAAQP